MKRNPDWRKTLRWVVERRRGISSSAGESLRLFFEQAFRHAQEPSASWFGFLQSGASLVIGHYYLAALDRKIWILVDPGAPSVPGFEFEPTGRSKNLRWLSSADLTSVKNLLDNPALWTSYERASRLALDSPDGRPRKDSYYRKYDKVRLSDFWPEPHRGDLLQELESKEPEIKVLPKTEAEAVRLCRIGQGPFRDSLLALWFNKCSVTGCKATRVLRASHLKPWVDSTNKDRLDPYNGLLLIPNLDAALDVGLITFDDDGKIRISSQLCSEDAASLGIVPTMRLSTIHKRHLKYLQYHRQQVFKK